MAAKASKPKWIARTMVEIAEFWGVATQTIRIGWRGEGMPGTPGAYDLAAIAQWWKAKNQNVGRPKSENKDDLEWKKYRALRAKLQYDAEKGELVPKDELKASVMRVAVAFRDRVYAMIPALVQDLEATKTERQRSSVILAHVESYLQAVSNDFQDEAGGAVAATQKRRTKRGRPPKKAKATA